MAVRPEIDGGRFVRKNEIGRQYSKTWDSTTPPPTP